MEERPRFVLRYRGEGVPPDDDVARVVQLPDAVMVDATPRMLLVESEQEALEALVRTMADWVMAPERGFPVPDVRKRAERRPPGA